MMNSENSKVVTKFPPKTTSHTEVSKESYTLTVKDGKITKEHESHHAMDGKVLESTHTVDHDCKEIKKKFNAIGSGKQTYNPKPLEIHSKKVKPGTEVKHFLYGNKPTVHTQVVSETTVISGKINGTLTKETTQEHIVDGKTVEHRHNVETVEPQNLKELTN